MKHLIPEFNEMRKRYPPDFESSLVIPCVRRIQEDRGYVADSDIDELVEYLGVPRIQIEEVLAFYTMLRRAPIGRYHLQVCHNVSCSMRGAERLVAQLTRTLGIAPGQTTPDGRYTLSTVECLASCGTAPMMMINDTYYENLDLTTVDALIAQVTSEPHAERHT